MTRLVNIDVLLVSSKGQGQYNTIGDAYTAAKAGDTIVVMEDQTITSQIDWNKEITIEFYNGKKIIINSNISSSPVLLRGALVTKNLKVEYQTKSTGQTYGIEIPSGNDGFHENMKMVWNVSGQTLTSAIRLASGVEGHYLNALVVQQAGTITNALTDDSLSTTNDINVRAR